MPAAYLDPFAQIVNLHKPANKSAIILAEFGPGAYTEGFISPPPGYTNAYQSRWDGDVRIWLVPKLNTLNTSQIIRIIQSLVYYPYFPGQPDPPHGWIGNAATGPNAGTLYYFATQEEALAWSLMVPVGDVTRGPSIGPCVSQSAILEKLVVSTLVNDRNDYSCTDFPLYQAAYGQVGAGGPKAWDTDGFTIPTITPPALDSIIAVSIFRKMYDEDVALLRANNYVQMPVNPSTGSENPPATLVTGTVTVPAVVTGQTQFNSQRTANLAYAGSVNYP